MTPLKDLATRFTLLFDLDGTLIDSAPDLQAAVNTVLSSHGLRRITLEETKSFIGDGMPKLCERALDVTGGATDLLDSFYTDFRGRYQAAAAVKTKPYPAVRETLISAKSAGFQMGVCTNKAEPLADLILDTLKLRVYFSAVIGAAPGRALKPDPEPLMHCMTALDPNLSRQAVFIGDSIADVRAARNAELPCILVRGGYTNVAPDLLDADVVIDSFDHLFSALDQLAKEQ